MLETAIPVLTLAILATFVDDPLLVPLHAHDASWALHALLLYALITVPGVVSPVVLTAYGTYFALLACKRVNV